MATRLGAALVWRSLVYFRRSHGALGLGIAAATAVIVGALVVGDSMRHSLRKIVLQRLANVELILQAPEFFDWALVERVDWSAVNQVLSPVPVILLSESSAESKQRDQLRRASRVQVMGIDSRFVDALDEANKKLFPTAPGPDQVMINAALARELNLSVGDELTLRLSRLGGVPADNPLGRRDEGPLAMPRQKVVAIIDDASIGGFQLQSTQEVTLNVFASLASLQDLLSVDSRVNASLVFSSRPNDQASVENWQLADQLSQGLRPKIDDWGLQLHRRTRNFPDQTRGETSVEQPNVVFDYFQLTSKQLLLDNSLVDALSSKIDSSGSYKLMSYLANSICKVDPLPQEAERQRRDVGPLETDWPAPESREINSLVLPAIGRMVPYSIVTGVGPVAAGTDDLKLWSYSSIPREQIRAPYCWINSWLAEQIEASPGDWIQLQFYEPETADGQLRQSQVRLLVVGVVPLKRPTKPFSRNRMATFEETPTRFNDPDFTPTVDGITDQSSISNWDVPFELELRDLILPQDDQYWEEHRLTPKVFVPLAYAQRVFGSRFGSTTAIHLTANDTTDEQDVRSNIEEGLLSVRALRGWSYQPIRARQLQSATGTTPFDWLFLSLSSFVIIAALMLVALLFQLAVQQRTAQLGLMLSQGFSPIRLRRLILSEMLVVAILGAGVGVLLGLGYAKLIVLGLQSWWIGAISTRFLQFSYGPESLCFGATAGMLASMLTIQLVLRRATLIQPLRLLQADEGRAIEESQERSTAWWAVSLFSALAAVLLLALAVGQVGMARAGFFFGSGMLLLASALLAVRQWLSLDRRSHRPEKQGLVKLALRAMVRNPVRSSLSISLLAVASFLITSMSVFQVSPNPQGYGGFDLLAVSTQPIYENLGSPRARSEAIGTPAEQLLGTTIIPLRMRQGDDASCTNLFQVGQPTVLGLSQRLQKLNDLTSHFRFSWASTADANAPWMVLQSPGNGTLENPVPVILDQNTAMWSLKQGGQLQSPISIEMDGRTIHFRVVGLLSNSVLQGKLIISERNFEYLFPQISGYRFFLIHSGQRNDAGTVAAVLEKGWVDAGLDVTSSVDILKRLLGVQNTYISAFQSLGALGLLLGTLGLIAVQIRSIIERRQELALMQALGFSPWRIGKLLSLESALLLLAGLLIGVGCAAVALVPYVIEFGPQINVFHSLLMLAIVLVCGLVAAAIAVRYALRLPLLRSLRGS